MAKRSSTKKTKRDPATAEDVSGIERQVLAFAEQLGYVAGSIQSRTEGLVDRKALSRQVASVRDGAKQLLDQLATGVASRVRRRSAPKKPVRKARSGGTVDAPGKKHRKPAPAGPPAAAARTRNTRVSQAAPRARAMGYRPRQG
jgi:hypothetical protein